MRYEAFLDTVLSQVRRLGFVDGETQHVDVADVESAAYRALLDIIEGWELDEYTRINENIATTEEGLRVYRLPGDFGRWKMPRGEYSSGTSHQWRQTESTCFLSSPSDSNNLPLRYREPEQFLRLQTTTNGRPHWFTVEGDTILLDPPPDSNNDANYTLKGTYIRHPDVLDDGDPILVNHATALIAATVARMAIDRGDSRSGILKAEEQRALNKLVNNQARRRQYFRSQYLDRSLRRWS